MRTTITLDDDAAAGLKNLQRKNPGVPFKELVNQIIKRGLAVSGEISDRKFEIKPLAAAHNQNYNFDNIGELIEIIEEDSKK